MQHQNEEIFPYCVQVHCGIDTVKVESNLEHVEPSEGGVYRFTRVPFCVCVYVCTCVCVCVCMCACMCVRACVHNRQCCSTVSAVSYIASTKSERKLGLGVSPCSSPQRPALRYVASSSID